MKTTITMAFAVLGCAFMLASPAAAQPLLAGGKTTQALYDCSQSFDDVTNELTVSLTVPKGVRKRMLVVAAHARQIGVGTCPLTMNLDFGTEDGFGGSTNGMMGAFNTAVGTWWADLDALEAAAPGSFVGVPFPVALHLFRGSGSTCQAACVSLSVQTEKK